MGRGKHETKRKRLTLSVLDKMTEIFNREQLAFRKKSAIVEIKEYVEDEVMSRLIDKSGIEDIIDEIEDWMKEVCQHGMNIRDFVFGFAAKNEEPETITYVYTMFLPTVKEVILSSTKVIQDIQNKRGVEIDVQAEIKIDLTSKIGHYILREWNKEHKDLMMKAQYQKDGVIKFSMLI